MIMFYFSICVSNELCFDFAFCTVKKIKSFNFQDPVAYGRFVCLTKSDSWFQVGVVLSTGVNSAYALGYSGTIMVPLGWVGGVVGLALSTAISLYASALIAKLHEVGGKRHIRYRDLAGFIYGMKNKNNEQKLKLLCFYQSLLICF